MDLMTPGFCPRCRGSQIKPVRSSDHGALWECLGCKTKIVAYVPPQGMSPAERTAARYNREIKQFINEITERDAMQDALLDKGMPLGNPAPYPSFL